MLFVFVQAHGCSHRRRKTVEQVEKVQAKRQKRLFEEDNKDKYKQIEDSQQAKKGKYNHEPSPVFTVPTRYQKVSRKKKTCGAQVRKRLASHQVSEYLQAVEDCLGPNAKGTVPKGSLESPFLLSLAKYLIMFFFPAIQISFKTHVQNS